MSLPGAWASCLLSAKREKDVTVKSSLRWVIYAVLRHRTKKS